MAKFRKKPVVIEALRFTQETRNQVYNFVTCNKVADFGSDMKPILKIETLEGTMVANLGDWVIKGIGGEFYPCKSDVFDLSYEPVE